MQKRMLRATMAVFSALATIVFLSGCSALHGDQTGTPQNEQLTKERQAKIQAHKGTD